MNEYCYRRSQGVHSVHVHPREIQNWGPNLREKVVSAPPKAEHESNFLRKLGRFVILAVGEVI